MSVMFGYLFIVGIWFWFAFLLGWAVGYQWHGTQLDRHASQAIQLANGSHSSLNGAA